MDWLCPEINPRTTAPPLYTACPDFPRLKVGFVLYFYCLLAIGRVADLMQPPHVTFSAPKLFDKTKGGLMVQKAAGHKGRRSQKKWHSLPR